MSSIALEAVEDEDIKLSDDVEELGPGFGCTSPQQYRKTYSQVMTRITSILFDMTIVSFTFFWYVAPRMTR